LLLFWGIKGTGQKTKSCTERSKATSEPTKGALLGCELRISPWSSFCRNFVVIQFNRSPQSRLGKWDNADTAALALHATGRRFYNSIEEAHEDVTSNQKVEHGATLVAKY